MRVHHQVSLLAIHFFHFMNQIVQLHFHLDIVQAVLSLLVRVLHSQKIASMCLNMGGADVILSLPGSCHFTGNSTLVTLVLRRMLEDDVTLQAMMETEIRSQVTKLFKKQHRGSVGMTDQQPKATMKPFMQAITPLICRSPLIAVRSIACCVKFEPKGDQSSSLSSSRDARVVLLTPEERAKNAKLLSSQCFYKDNGLGAATIPNKKVVSTQSQEEQANPGRSKSPHHSKKDRTESKKIVDGSPPNHITSLLLARALQNPAVDIQAESKRPFLMTHDYLDILSDLVFAIPSCGAGVHRYKPPVELCVHHALPNCPDPPQTAVSFLLHRLITLPRTKSKSLASGDKLKIETPECKRAIERARISQTSARLIVALVARSGEGRR